MTPQSTTLSRYGLFCGYALNARLSPAQMAEFIRAREAGECAAAAFGRAKKLGAAS